ASSRRFPATAIARYLVASALRCAPTIRPDVAECGGAPGVWAGGPGGWAGAPPHPAADAATTAARAAISAQPGRPGLALTARYCRPAARRASCLALRRHVGFHRLPGAVHLWRLVPGQLAAVDGYHGAGDERGLVRAEPEHGLRHLTGRARPGHRRGQAGQPLGPRAGRLPGGGQDRPPPPPPH